MNVSMKINKNLLGGMLSFSVYLLSYIYLAIYHQRINLFNTIIHESGALTFAQTLFYSSHFLAHIPVHIVVVLIFVGTIRLFSNPVPGSSGIIRKLLALLIIFTGLAFIHSLLAFGFTDTYEYIFQKKQGLNIYGEGGSWRLHLVSTISVLFLIPAYIFLFLKFLKINVRWNPRSMFFIAAGIIIIPVFCFLFDGSFFNDLKYAFTNNRYLAHSVRELATFPVTYFPLLMLFAYDFRNFSFSIDLKAPRQTRMFVMITTVIFAILFLYQAILPLREGIENLAQKPSFAKGEGLPVFYLLASHYFEHFADTIFFTILGLIFYYKQNKKGMVGGKQPKTEN